jgi:CheY-like chemotaxis protein/anti-sigma regulatory factor (Ser/Thr protein kinase)
MPTILIAEDTRTQARMIQFMLEGEGFQTEIAANGLLALKAIEQRPPDIVLTDLHMPEMNGLELVEAIRSRFPSIPVVLMTADGSEEIAVQALQKGAASYVPKRYLEADLVRTLRSLLDAARVDRDQQRLLDCIEQQELHFKLDNDPTLVPPLTAHLRQSIARMQLCDATATIRVGVALQEAILNAMHHGNLELKSELRELPSSEYYKLGDQRRHQPPFDRRRVYVSARLSRSEAVYTIRDEGPGFDPATLPDPTNPENIEKCSGRGLLLIRTFMDHVSHNALGNELTMIKRRDANRGK